jgi:hypothetical protein
MAYSIEFDLEINKENIKNIFRLKGQCNKIAVEMRPWNTRLMVANPFFCLKIARLKDAVPRVTYPSI